MDKEQFSRLAMEQQRRLYRIAVSYTASSADAEDAVQEALLRAWSKRDTLREEALFATWLTRIVINECKSLLRKRKRQVPAAELPQIAAPPEDDQAAELREALFALPEKERVPLVLNLLEGYTMQQIAGILHLPLNTVKSRIARAKKKLEKEAKDHAQ